MPYTLTLFRRVRVGKTTPYKHIKFKLVLEENQFEDPMDEVKILCAVESSINNHCELPVRAHITETT